MTVHPRRISSGLREGVEGEVLSQDSRGKAKPRCPRWGCGAQGCVPAEDADVSVWPQVRGRQCWRYR